MTETTTPANAYIYLTIQNSDLTYGPNRLTLNGNIEGIAFPPAT